MKEGIIQVACGFGAAPTELAAFDAALFDAGIANFNLMRMSSVVPLGYRPKTQSVCLPDSGKGDRLYVVYAAKTVAQQGQMAAAGLGWIMAKATPPWGLFVEHVGDSHEAVQDQIDLSLNAMISYRTGVQWCANESEIVSKTCDSEPICVLAAAVYGSEPWSPGRSGAIVAGAEEGPKKEAAV